MKNNQIVYGDFAVIELNKRNGEKLFTLVDAEDLPRLNEYPGKLYAHQCRATGSYYVKGNSDDGTQFRLHRFLMNAPEEMVVDHINHDTLDNRKTNLRLVTTAQNNQNIKGANKRNHSSGIRGVSFHKASGKWQAHLKLNGIKQYLGLYESKEEAGLVVEKARALHMPYSQEAL